MSILQELVIRLGLDSKGYKNALTGVAKETENFGRKIGGILAPIAIGTAVAAGLIAVTNVLKDCAKAAMEAEDANAKLKGILTSTAGASGMTFEALDKQANAIQRVTRFDDELIKTGQATLLTMTNIGSKVFPRATQAMVDMAAKTGDVSGSAALLGKVLQSPLTNMGLLARQGMGLSDIQQKQVADFMAVNDVASAQGVILDAIEGKVGGLAEVMGSTTAGQMERFKNQVEEIKERIGEKLLPVINSVVGSLANWLTSPEGQASIDKFVGWIGTAMGTVSPPAGLLGLVNYLSSGNIKGAVDLAFGSGSFTSLTTFITNIQSAARDIQKAIDDIQKAIDDFRNIILPKDKELTPLFEALRNIGKPEINLPSYARPVPPELPKDTWAKERLLDRIPIPSVPPYADSGISEGIKGLVEGVQKDDNRLLWDTEWTTMANVPLTAIEAVKEPLIFTVTDTATQMANGLSSKTPEISAVGTNMMGALEKSIRMGQSGVVNAIVAAVLAAIAAANKALGIQSPSKVMMKMGKQMTEGLKAGLGNISELVNPRSLNIPVSQNVTSGGQGQNVIKIFGPTTFEVTSDMRVEDLLSQVQL